MDYEVPVVKVVSVAVNQADQVALGLGIFLLWRLLPWTLLSGSGLLAFEVFVKGVSDFLELFFWLEEQDRSLRVLNLLVHLRAQPIPVKIQFTQQSKNS